MTTEDATTEPVRRVRGAALVLAPLLLVAATMTFVGAGGFFDSSAVGALQFVAMAVLAIGIPAVTAAVQPDFPRAAAVLAVIAALGVAAGAGFGIERIYTGTGAGTLENVAAGTASLYPLGLLFPLGMIGHGVALARGTRHGLPAWLGWALVAGGVLFPVSRIGDIPALALVADSFLALGLVPLGWRLLAHDRAGAWSTSAGPATA